MVVAVWRGLRVEALTYTPAYRCVVNSDMPDRSLGVDDNCAPERNAVELVRWVLDQEAKGAGNILAHIGEKRDLHRAQPALVAGSVHPCVVAVGTIDGGADYLAADGLELVRLREVQSGCPT